MRISIRDHLGKPTKCVSNGVVVDLSSGKIPYNVYRQLGTNTYEEAETKLIRRHLNSSIPVIELGAGIGYTSSLIGSQLDDSIKHITVEANPGLLETIGRTKEINNLNFIVVNRAYSSEAEKVTINIDKSFPWTSTSPVPNPVKTKTVKSVTLDELKNEFNIDIFSLVMDIEGGEFDLIANESELLSSCCHSLFIEFHKNRKKNIDNYIEILESNNLKLEDEIDNVFYFRNTAV